MNGFVIEKESGRVLVFGTRMEGTKVARFAELPGNEFVSSADPRAADFYTAIEPPKLELQLSVRELQKILQDQGNAGVKAAIASALAQKQAG